MLTLAPPRAWCRPFCCSNALPFSSAVCRPTHRRPLCHHVLSTTRLNHYVWSHQHLQQRQVSADAHRDCAPDSGQSLPASALLSLHLPAWPPCSTRPAACAAALLQACAPELGLPLPRALTPSTAPPPLHQMFLEFRPGESLSLASQQETGSSQGWMASQRAMGHRGGKA
jgi:hypothetical protein